MEFDAPSSASYSIISILSLFSPVSRRDISCFLWVSCNDPVNTGKKHLPPLLIPSVLSLTSASKTSLDNEDTRKALHLIIRHIKQWTERPENTNDFSLSALGCEMNNCNSVNRDTVKCIAVDKGRTDWAAIWNVFHMVSMQITWLTIFAFWPNVTIAINICKINVGTYHIFLIQM